jgi:hypothetical protein
MVVDACIQVSLLFGPMEHSYEAWQWYHKIIQLSGMLGGDWEYTKFYWNYTMFILTAKHCTCILMLKNSSEVVYWYN